MKTRIEFLPHTDRIFCFIAILLSLTACNSRPPYPELALTLAGDNRAELEKTLAHYSKDPADSLEYRAACFLIENMVGHHELSSPTMDSLKSAILGEGFPESRKTYDEISAYDQIVKQKLNRFKEASGNRSTAYTSKPDLKYITGDYLIRNIDISFRIWKDVPWHDAISFDDFCEGILPYRVGNEPVEDWKELYHREFRPVIDSIRNSGDIRQMCRILCDYLNNQHWMYEAYLHLPELGPSDMLNFRVGSCEGQAKFTVCVLRSLGIPAYIDKIVQNANAHWQSHYWNRVEETNGNRFYVEFYNIYDEIEDFNRDRRYGKIYRTYYSLQPSSLPVKLKGKPVPSTLANPFLADVSHEYFPDVHITVEPECPVKKGEILFLNVFNGSQWIPAGWTEAGRESRRVRFCHVEPDVLYLASVIRDGKTLPVTAPFILKGNENACFIQADTESTGQMKLLRKYRTTSYWPERLSKAIGGKFQGACRADFSDTVTLHEIVDTISLGMTVIPVHHTQKFKYVRYISPASHGNRIAELRFISAGKPLQGKIICSDGLDKQSRENVADDNPLTSFRLEKPGSWTGFAFESARQINEIRFQYWNDDNSIRRNDEYELLYWADNKWKSLGRQTGNDTCALEYKHCPVNALFLLHNHTRGQEERPFTYENGKQFFW